MTRAPTICAKPGCPAEATHRGRCDAHQRKAWARRSPSSVALSGSAEHRRQRKAALARTGGRCERCGRERKDLQLHHPHQISAGGAIVQDLAELLCKPCHRLADREAASGAS